MSTEPGPPHPYKFLVPLQGLAIALVGAGATAAETIKANASHNRFIA
jgi:hypothetical protein